MIYKQTKRQYNFSIASIAERIMLCDFYRNQLDFDIEEIVAVNSSQHYDCSIYSGGSAWLTEIKLRHCRCNTYPDNWIEVEKYNEVICEAQRQGKTPYFLLSFEDGIAIWRLDHIPIDKKEWKSYNKYTATGEKDGKKLVEVIILNRECATIYNWQRKSEIELKKQAEKWYKEKSDSELMNINWIKK